MDKPSPILLAVETYSGYQADERPVSLQFVDRRIAVKEILDRWHGEDHTYFKVTGDDNALYLIRHDRQTDAWELIRMEAPTAPRHP